MSDENLTEERKAEIRAKRVAGIAKARAARKAKREASVTQAPIEEIGIGEPAEQIGIGDEGDAPELATVQVEETQDRIETPTLSADEIEAIKTLARSEVEKEFKKKLKDKALAEEKEKVRSALSMHENEHLQGALSDLVRITIDIPEYCNVPWIQINQPTGQCYIHGQTYVVKRHVGNTLRETMQWMRRHQNEIDGKKRNRVLPDGRFVDVVTGYVTPKDQMGHIGSRSISAKDAAA